MRAALLVRALGLTTVTVAAGGCGLSPAPRRSADARVAQAQSSHEYPSARRRAQSASGASRTPPEAVAAFARAYINWTANSVSQDMRELATRSVGQARSVAQLAAAQTAGDYELERGGIANSGTVEAIAAVAGHPDQFVVVTREVTTATATTAYQGLQPAWHVAIATVQPLAPGEWVVSGWQPKS
jgi:hypothetical protein